MSKHNETGAKGEQIAVNFLQNKGYQILQRNWCSGKKEIDIIAHREDLLIFIEVKTRSGIRFAFPEESVQLRKQNFLRAAAEAYLEMHPGYSKIQFDVISVWLVEDEIREIVHFEDAF